MNVDMNKVTKLATKVLASTAAGIAATVVLTTSGGTAVADGCPEDMHWLVCPPVGQVTETVDDVTDTIGDVTGDVTRDMHW